MMMRIISWACFELRLAFSTDNVDDVTTVVSGRHDTKALDDSFTGRIVLSGI